MNNTLLRLSLRICARNIQVNAAGIKTAPFIYRGLIVNRCFHTSFKKPISFSGSSFALPPTTPEAMAKTALVVIATGSEEIEAVTPVDTLRRVGVEVTVAGLTGAGNVVMSRNVIMGAEKSLKDALASAPFDAIILPGGLKGAEAFAESAELGEILKEQEKAGRLVAAICAGPTALHKHDICVGKAVTSYPSVKDRMTVDGKYDYKEDRVVVDGNLITSRGPGTSLEFSLAIVAHLVGQEKADEIGKAMLLK